MMMPCDWQLILFHQPIYRLRCTSNCDLLQNSYDSIFMNAAIIMDGDKSLSSLAEVLVIIHLTTRRLIVRSDEVARIFFLEWASYQLRKIVYCARAGNAGNVFPRRRLQRKPLVSDPGKHQVTCVTHVLWCMSGSLTRGGGENVPGFPDACAPVILRIW